MTFSAQEGKKCLCESSARFAASLTDVVNRSRGTGGGNGAVEGNGGWGGSPRQSLRALSVSS